MKKILSLLSFLPLALLACGGAVDPESDAAPDAAPDAGPAWRCAPEVSAGGSLACAATDVDAGAFAECACPDSCAIVRDGIAAMGRCVRAPTP